MNTNTEFTATIERMGYGSFGIAHNEAGKCIFVEGGVTGDVVQIITTEDKPTFARGHVTQIVETSPLRAKTLPPFARECGADWAELAYSTQLAEKLAGVKSALARTAHLAQDEIEAIVQDIRPCKREWEYRNKIEMAAFRDNAGRFNVGFYKQGTADPQPVEACPLALRGATKAPRALRGAIRHLQGADDLGIYRIGVRTSVRTRDTQVALWTEPSPFPRAHVARTIKEALGANSVVRVLAKHDSARRVKKVEILDGGAAWHEQLRINTEGGASTQTASANTQSQLSAAPSANLTTLDFYISAPSFFQVNTAQAEVLIELVIDALGGPRALKAAPYISDLYCGAGTFTISLATLGADVVGVELAGSSTRDLARNLDANKVDAEVICDDVARVIGELDGIEAAVVDPPRAGLDKQIIKELAAHKNTLKTIVYVSCDPQTLARDTARLKNAGFNLVKLTPVDMFPQTFHVECVAVFQ
jgi:23S rRNA (uracil1939-C5)-methyltransferase